MKLFKQILAILIVFFKTGNLLSENNLFNVNNILVNKEENLSNNQLADKAIKKAFDQLSKKILLKKDFQQISELNYSDIKDLVAYYNISKKSKNDDIIFNVKFDKKKIHNLLYNIGILYSDISDKDFYILPIFLKQNEIYIFSNNYFYKNWNEFDNDDLIEFILPIENIEIIQNINKSRENLLSLNLDLIFNEYVDKNIALVFIEEDELNKNKIYLKAKIQGKFISKNLNFKKNLKENNSKKEVIYSLKEEIINLVKSENLIDIRTPSFLNVKVNLKKNNLVLLKSKINNVDLIEEIFVQEFNRDYVNIKIKFLGKLERMINQLKKEKIILQLINEEWMLKNL